MLVVALGAGERRWEEALLPLEAGRFEVKLGAGAQAWAPGVTSLSPSPIFSLRVGLFDRITLSFPLIATVMLADADGARPGVLLTGGLGGIGFSSIQGVITFPSLHAEAFWRGRSLVALVRAGLRGQVASRGSTPYVLSAELEGVLLQSLGERVSIGMSISFTQWLLPAGLGNVAWFGAGSWSMPLSGPVLRVRLTPSWAIDAVMRVSGDLNAPTRSLSAGLSAVWSPRGWEPER